MSTRRNGSAANLTRPSVAIVGGGISGLNAARQLQESGVHVNVFDRGRGPGGRASTRRIAEHRFDHGAQYFTARDASFRLQVDAWRDEGVVAEWFGRIAVIENRRVTPKESDMRRFVGVPGMSAIAKRLAASVPLRRTTLVDRLDRAGDGWQLHADDGADLGIHDAVVLALAPEQALPFLERSGSTLAELVRPVRSDPCWAVMAVFDGALDVEFDGAFVNSGPLAWIARNSSKPGRPREESWVLHAGPEWSRRHIEERSGAVARGLLKVFFNDTGAAPRAPAVLEAHRWRLSVASNPLSVGALWDDELRLGVCGDWCQRCRIEGAFLSGAAMAGEVLAAGVAG